MEEKAEREGRKAVLIKVEEEKKEDPHSTPAAARRTMERLNTSSTNMMSET
jgi:hypothetical protein